MLEVRPESAAAIQLSCAVILVVNEILPPLFTAGVSVIPTPKLLLPLPVV
jgi:hypothetical protein